MNTVPKTAGITKLTAEEIAAVSLRIYKPK
jgi:hypothetical protein